MENNINKHIETLIERYPALACCKESIQQAYDILKQAYAEGNSRNVLYAAVVAKAKGLKVIGLTGQKPNRLAQLADVCIRVPATETYKIQELHLPVYHCLCLMLEEHFFGNQQS